jgi:hypothetical protein
MPTARIILLVAGALVAGCRTEPAQRLSLRTSGPSTTSAANHQDGADATRDRATPRQPQKGASEQASPSEDAGTGSGADPTADESAPLPASQLAWDGATFRGDAVVALIPID